MSDVESAPVAGEQAVPAAGESSRWRLTALIPILLVIGAVAVVVSAERQNRAAVVPEAD